jgi:uncharacterized membrane-anchored protein
MPMPDERVWTAAELEQLTPDERQRLLNERGITDLSQVPPEFLAKVRARGRVLLEERGVISPQGDGR